MILILLKCWGLFYDAEYSLSWWMVHMHLKRIFCGFIGGSVVNVQSVWVNYLCLSSFLYHKMVGDVWGLFYGKSIPLKENQSNFQLWLWICWFLFTVFWNSVIGYIHFIIITFLMNWVFFLTLWTVSFFGSAPCPRNLPCLIWIQPLQFSDCV